jgi:Tfp pilus assembly protein FimT
MKKILKNKRGVTLIELLAYTALIGVVVSLFGGLMRNVALSYDRINGQGAIMNQANNIMNHIVTKTNAIELEYAAECPLEEAPEKTCIILAPKDTITISDSGIIEYVSNTEVTKIYFKDNNIYINQVKLNNHNFGIDPKKSKIEFLCPENAISGGCQRPIIQIELAIGRINQKGELVDPIIYNNRFTIN